MLSNNSICNNCSVKKICKHYSYAIKNTDINISITECDINRNINKLEKEKIEIPNYSHFIKTPTNNPSSQWKPSVSPICDSNTNNSHISETYDNQVALLNTKFKDMNITKVEQPKAKCEKCGNLAVLSNCTDCGKRICSQCGYTTVNVNTGIPEITCDDCFNGGNSDTIDDTTWSIDKFIEEEVVKEEDKDVKSTTRKQTTNKRPSKKSKDK